MPEEQIDLAAAKLTIDKMIDPTIDIPENIKRLDELTSHIKRMAEAGRTDADTMLAMIAYIYDGSPWNDGKIFSYDLDDPMGTKVKNKLLSNYLETRKGNCVSMPMLLIILGQKLDIDVALVRAPQHLFVHFKDETGKIYNIEGIAKGTISNERYKTEHFITDQAIENGIYLQSLTRKRAITDMLMTVAQHYREKQDYQNVLLITDLVLEYDPKSVSAMLSKGNIYWRISQDYLRAHGYKLNQTENNHYRSLTYNNWLWFNKAQALGWTEPPKDYDEKYMAMIQSIKAAKQTEGEAKNENH